MIKHFLLLLSLALTTLTFAQKRSALFLGNSYTAYNNLPQLVYNIALSHGDTLVYDSNTPGGYTFNLHRTNATTLSKIESRNWDFVVLQEQSQIPALPEAITGPDYSPPHAATLNEIIKENDSCTKVVFYMTWGRKTGDASFCDEHPPVCTYEGMQGELRNTYLDMAVENDARVAPVGMGWKTVIEDDPSIELYAGDGSHPNINGSYLTACIMYASIYQKSPMESDFTASLDEELAAYLQAKAHDIVFDSLDTWRIGLGDLTADFDYSNTETTYDFENNSENATSWEWEIDDMIYTDENPIHTFDEAGFYDVTLTAYDGCDTISTTQTVAVGSASLSTYDQNVNLFPNPASSSLQIALSTNDQTLIEIYDLLGQQKEARLVQGTTEIDLSNYTAGTYILKIEQEFYRFVKE